MIMGLAVFVTDLAISFMGWQRLDSWLTGNKLRCLAWNAALDLAIAVNTIGFIEERWWMLVPSLLGSSLGTMASFKWRVW